MEQGPIMTRSRRFESVFCTISTTSARAERTVFLDSGVYRDIRRKVFMAFLICLLEISRAVEGQGMSGDCILVL